MFARFVLFAFAFYSTAFGAGNYKPVKGLEPKEKVLVEDGTKEITIKKRTIVKRNESKDSSNRKFLNSNHFCDNKEMCRYFSFSFSTPLKTYVSKDFETKTSLGVAKPISDKRFGLDFFVGGKPFATNYVDVLFGVSYDLAYFDAKYKQIPDSKQQEYGIHAIAPSVRVMIDLFPENKFSVYFGGDAGIAILNLVRGGDYSVKYSYKVAGFTNVGYKLGERNTFEIFAGYRAFYVPEVEFLLGKDKVKTNFSGHALQAGLKVKF